MYKQKRREQSLVIQLYGMEIIRVRGTMKGMSNNEYDVVEDMYMDRRIKRRMCALLIGCIVCCIAVIVFLIQLKENKDSNFMSVAMFAGMLSLFFTVGNTAVLISLLAQRRAMRKIQ